MILQIILLTFSIVLEVSTQYSLQGFDDSILYSINWISPSSEIHSKETDRPDSITYEEIVMQTDSREQYKCRIPHVIDNIKDSQEKYSGPNALELIGELFTQSSCSYRLEAYWTYELCHGRYIRQYHEEREGKTVKLQEYFLGRWDKLDQDRLRNDLGNEEISQSNVAAPVKKIDGLNMPYFQLNMTDGTMCDLNTKPRMTSVLYVCYALGKHEIYSLKETSICEYEIIVLSPLICSHPKYRPQTSGENTINCSPIGLAGRLPKSLLQLETESVLLQHQNSFGNSVPLVRLELLPMDEAIDENSVSAAASASSPIESSAFKSFVDGTDCIQGGSGWWKYEFCYGKSITQFHIEKDGSKVMVNLGNFIKSGHLKWIKANPHKRLVVGSHVSYLYSMGSICDETGLPRQTEVKLKCVENRKNPDAVSMYLLEPKTCQYILGVESRTVCRLLNEVDEYGFFVGEDVIGFTKSDYSSGYLSPTEKSDSKVSKAKESAKEVKITIGIVNEENHIADGDE